MCVCVCVCVCVFCRGGMGEGVPTLTLLFQVFHLVIHVLFGFGKLEVHYRVDIPNDFQL